MIWCSVVSHWPQVWYPMRQQFATRPASFEVPVMQYQFAQACFLIGMIGLACLGCGRPSEPVGVEEASPSDMAIEVDALRTLHYFKITPEQMKSLQKLAPETAQPARPRKSKASDDYRQALADLHGA